MEGALLYSVSGKATGKGAECIFDGREVSAWIHVALIEAVCK